MNVQRRDVCRLRSEDYCLPATIWTELDRLEITVTVRRAGGSADEAAAGVHLVKGGVVGDADRSIAGPWAGPELTDVESCSR